MTTSKARLETETGDFVQELVLPLLPKSIQLGDRVFHRRDDTTAIDPEGKETSFYREGQHLVVRQAGLVVGDDGISVIHAEPGLT